MTPSSDDLFEVWRSDPGSGRIDRGEILRQLEKRTRGFDRMIWFRDLREGLAGGAVALVFLWFAVHDSNWMERAAHLWLAACGAWIVLAVRRYSSASRNPSPEQDLAAYGQALLARYDRQIRLLKGVKYWYLLPFWLGLMFSQVAHVANGGHRVASVLAAAVVTVVFAGIWWLNEVAGVRYLRRKRDELLEMTGQDAAGQTL